MSETEWEQMKCKSCGDRFRQKKGSLGGYYTCMKCGGTTTRVSDLTEQVDE